MSTEKKKISFVNDELRPYAMKLHTKDQAPREGQQPAQTPFAKWEIGRQDYLNFLVDSLKVYETFERIIGEKPELEALRNIGIERSEALKKDIAWFPSFDSSLTVPECGEYGLKYSAHLEGLVENDMPKFMCHYYNHYFAHTAGGRMIGAKMAEKLLDKQVLEFYKWEGDVRAYLDNARMAIDAMATSWNEEEKQACLEETMACFKYSGSLMSYMKPPELRNKA